MEFIDFLREMLGITKDYGIIKIEKIEHPEKIIRIYLSYTSSVYKSGTSTYRLYDLAQEREWQHLSWFEYKCYLICRLPRYVDKDKKVKTVVPDFASPGKSYTHLFSHVAVQYLQKVRVQKTVAELMQTSPYIIRSIMEHAVEAALETRGFVTNLEQISIDEKAYAKGHEYATIVIDSKREYVVDMQEGRKEKSLKSLLYTITGEETQPQLRRVNIDMWQPYMKVIEELAPRAVVVHDKFHLIKKLSEAIDKTRRKEISESGLLKRQKYTVLKNADNWTKEQKSCFEQIERANLKTAQAWHVRENFKLLFQWRCTQQAEYLLKEWMQQSRKKGIFHVNRVVATFEAHLNGIINAITTKTDSSMHENMNGKIQSVIAKAKGFINFERFRINILFYFGNLQLLPQKI